MPYEKHKSELYKSIGGINEKSSNYATGENECLKLENLDFQEPGAYTSRWGFTQAASVGTTIMMNSLWQIANNLPGFTNAGSNIIAGSASSLFSVSLGNGSFAKIIEAGTSQVSSNTWSNAELSMFSYSTNGTTGLTSTGGFTNPSGVTYFTGITYVNLFKTANFGGTIGLTSARFGLPFVQNLDNIGGITFTNGGASLLYNYRLGLVDNFAGDDLEVKHYGPVDFPGSGFVFQFGGTIASMTIYGLTLTPGVVDFAPTHWALYRDNNGSVAADGTPIDPATLYLRKLVPIASTSIKDTTNAPVITPVVEKPTHFYINDVLAGGVPKYLETHLSRLWIATDSMVFFSEVSNPQAIPAYNYFSSNSEKFNISGLKALHGNMLVFLQKGVKRIVGDGQELADGTTNFAMHDLTKEYGCVSHKAIVIFQERCWFLDEGFIVEFNGANFTIVSNRIEDTMKTLDYAACKERASSLHVPERREVWFSVPSSGSLFNTVLVYDYVANAWTTFKGIEATCLSLLYTSTSAGRLNSPKVFFGTTLGKLNMFDSTYTTDLGVGFTCLVKGKFHNELGNSVQKVFRRVFVDGPSNGTTLPVGLNFYADHATATISLTMSAFVGNTMQYRVDFGISAKSCAVEFVHSTLNSQFKLYGYTMESRFLRKV